MKKTLVLLLTVMLVGTMLVGCGSDDAIYNPGTYEGKGEGYSGTTIVEVEVSKKQIEKIEIKEFNDSDFALEPAKQLIEAVIKANSSDVEIITGATKTSKGVLEAIEDALSQARVSDAVATKGENNADQTPLKDLKTDVVVIGAGGAGLTAAIEAKANGADVIVVEKMPLIGGNTKLATGGLNAAETKVQADLDI